MKKSIMIFYFILFACLSFNVSALKEETATVTVGEVEVPVYNVETSWGKMEFTYNEQINYIWNNTLHVYEEGNSTYKWIGTDNYIDITNKSYKPIDVELSYSSLNDDVNGSFDKTKSIINKNENMRFTLTLDGKLSNNNVEYTRVGMINLSIS